MSPWSGSVSPLGACANGIESGTTPAHEIDNSNDDRTINYRSQRGAPGVGYRRTPAAPSNVRWLGTTMSSGSASANGRAPQPSSRRWPKAMSAKRPRKMRRPQLTVAACGCSRRFVRFLHRIKRATEEMPEPTQSQTPSSCARLLPAKVRKHQDEHDRHPETTTVTAWPWPRDSIHLGLTFQVTCRTMGVPRAVARGSEARYLSGR